MEKLIILFAALTASFVGVADVAFERAALWPGFDGKWCKMQPSVATDGKGVGLMTYQHLLLTGIDVFSGQHVSKTTDGGRTWSTPVLIPDSKDIVERGLRVARYVNVHYSAFHKKWYATGIASMYDGDARPFQKYVDGKPYGYSVQGDVDIASGMVSNFRPLPFPFEYQSAVRFGQMVECDNGDVLMPFYFKPVSADRYAAVVVRYRFGKDGLEPVAAGTPLADESHARGICEPSLVKFRGKYYLTLRTDECGLLAESDDGLVFGKPIPWTWADGTPIGNANTQQHWVTVGEKLYLTYTRVTPTNGHVFRNRAPIFLAEFDPAKRCLKRETERPVVPERGARLGNFVVAPAAPGESWLVTAEWMQPLGCEKYGSDNSIWLVKFRPDDALARHRGVLCLTFDDGHFASWRKALPIFDRYGAKATFYVHGPIGKKQIDAIREFQSYGHTVGLHGFRHQKAVDRVAKVGLEAYLAEEVDSQLEPLRKAGLEVRDWGYPCSQRNEEIDRALEKRFARMRTGHIFNRDPAVTPLAACDGAFASRKDVAKSHLLWSTGFGTKYKGVAEDIAKGLERLAARDEVLIIYTHDVKETADGTPHNTTLSALETILSKASELGVAVVGLEDLESL